MQNYQTTKTKQWQNQKNDKTEINLKHGGMPKITIYEKDANIVENWSVEKIEKVFVFVFIFIFVFIFCFYANKFVVI